MCGKATKKNVKALHLGKWTTEPSMPRKHYTWEESACMTKFALLMHKNWLGSKNRDPKCSTTTLAGVQVCLLFGKKNCVSVLRHR